MLLAHSRINLILALIAVGVVITLWAFYKVLGGKFDPDRDSLKADFVARIICQGHAPPPDEFWERALTRLDFRSLNPPALARKYGIEYPVGGQTIWGLGAGDRIIQVHSSSSSYGIVDVVLQSPPPTVHDVRLEADLRSIISKAGCNLESVLTADNKLQSLPMFLGTLKTVKGWYAEADALQHR